MCRIPAPPRRGRRPKRRAIAQLGAEVAGMRVAGHLARIVARAKAAPGELVAFWVGQGNLRADTVATNQERSNFALVRWGENYRAD